MGGRRRWWATGVALALLAGVYAIEALVSGSALSADGRVLIAMGAESRGLVLSGELYRLFTDALLHANLEHLLANGVALAIAGYYLEPVVGWRWMVVLLGAGALGGSIASAAANPEVISVGASSAIMGVFAAGAIAIWRRFPEGKTRSAALWRFMRLLIPALIPIANRSQQGNLNIDVAGHVGGALAGCAIAPWLLRDWPAGEAAPQPSIRVRGTALATIALVALSAAAAAIHLPGQMPDLTAAAAMAPYEELQALDRKSETASRALVEKYPGDPRVRMMHAMIVLESRKDAAIAEADLRQALESAERNKLFRPVFTQMLRAMLAGVLMQEGKRVDARRTVEPLCASGIDPEMPKELVSTFAEMRKELCASHPR